MPNATEIAPTPMPVAGHALGCSSRGPVTRTRVRGGPSCWRSARRADRPAAPNCWLSATRIILPLGLVTVYRTLDLLLSLGLVRKLHLAEGCHTYALSLARQTKRDTRQ